MVQVNTPRPPGASRFFFSGCGDPRDLHSFPTRRSSDLGFKLDEFVVYPAHGVGQIVAVEEQDRSEEHTSELQSRPHLVCRLLLEKKNIYKFNLQLDMTKLGFDPEPLKAIMEHIDRPSGM